MRYNTNLLKPRVISVLGKDIKYCFESDYLNSLYGDYYKNVINNANIEDGRVKFKMDILENYIIYLFEKSKLTAEEKIIIDKAANFYNDLALHHPSLCLNSIIFSNFSYLGSAFFKDYDSINEILVNRKKVIRNYYDSYIKGNKLSEFEKGLLMEFIIGRIGDEKFYEVHENVFHKLLNSKDNISLIEKNFMMQYISYKKCKKLNLPMAKLYITKNDLFSGEDIKDKYSGVSHSNTGIIGLSRYVYNQNFNDINEKYQISNGIKMIHTVNHELEHYKQDSFVQSGKLSSSSFANIKHQLFIKYFSGTNFNEYKSNYQYREIEREANIRGWADTAKLLEVYAKDKAMEIDNCYRNYSKTSMEKAYSWQIKRSKGISKKHTIEEYNVECLIAIFKSHPEELHNYPQLKEFFDSNGDLINSFKFFEKYTELELVKLSNKDRDVRKEINDKQSCYLEFINYLFISKDFNMINFDGYQNYESMITFFSLLGEQYLEECKKIKNMCKTFEKSNYENFLAILTKRKERLDKYYSFINDNSVLISILNEYNQEHLNDRHRLFTWYVDLNKLNEEKNNVEKYIDIINSKIKGDNNERKL